MGPLQGLRLVELGGIGPVPFAGMLLSDMGAEILRVERPPGKARAPVFGVTDLEGTPADVLHRGRPSISLDLRDPRGVELLLALMESADGVFEGFRPGVVERLGVGPEVALARNPRLVYGRMTGYGQDGPLAARAGHDINYISIAGVLRSFARRGERPVPPLNLVGDFGGGGMLLAFGMVCALLEARTSGQGQVIDAAMVDGAALLSARIHSMRAGGSWNDEPGTNIIDTGAPFYEVYATADGGYMSVGPIEPPFYAELLRHLGVDGEGWPEQFDRAAWPELSARLAAVFATRTRAEWTELLEGTDACATPVLGLEEAPSHPHNVARGTFVAPGGVVQPAPAPRFSRTPAELRSGPPEGEQDVEAVLAGWGVSAAQLTDLRRDGALA
jgi:alpha-methylacyl-CoA racemase